MGAIALELLGLDLLVQHGASAERERRTCLVCRHYQLRDKGREIICTRRPKTSMASLGWSPAYYAKAIIRAKRCQNFDDMREE